MSQPTSTVAKLVQKPSLLWTANLNVSSVPMVGLRSKKPLLTPKMPVSNVKLEAQALTQPLVHPANLESMPFFLARNNVWIVSLPTASTRMALEVKDANCAKQERHLLEPNALISQLLVHHHRKTFVSKLFLKIHSTLGGRDLH